MSVKNLSEKFITFEGIEGSGKSTHSEIMSNFLKTKGLDVVYTREPGGTPIGEKIRGILLSLENSKMTLECELLLYMASRAQLVNEVIKPSLESGKIVICDRFLDASICYQGYGAGLDIDTIKKIGDYAIGSLYPGLTVFLDADVEETIKKIKDPDRIEVRSLDYHRKVRDGYLELARLNPERIKTVKVQENIEETQRQIRDIVGDFLSISV